MFEFKQRGDILKQFLDILMKCPLFAGLSEEEILTSLHSLGATVRQIPKNQYIIRAGDRTDCISLLVSGSALVIQEDLWGNRNIMTKLSPSDYFAEAFAVIPDAILSVSVTATDECIIIEISMNRLLAAGTSLSHQQNLLIKNLITALAKKTLMFNDKITHMSRRKTRDKLLSYLSVEAIRQGSLSFDIPFDRQQLADFLCVERAAMSAELSKLQKEGFLKTDHSHFELNPETI